MLLYSTVVFAQDMPSGGTTDSAAPDPAEVIRPTEPETQDSDSTHQPLDKRAFGVLPNYDTANETGVYKPITSKQKLRIAVIDTIDYPVLLTGAGYAGLAQLANQHPNFGQGMKGYSLRYITSFTDQASQNLLTEGIMPILFHEDPRYFRIGPGAGGFWYRAGYAASRIFWNKTDRGNNRFNFSEVVGSSISAGLGSAYYRRERDLDDNIQRLYVALATDAFGQILKEFWPDFKQKFLSHRQKNTP
ncbi:MAG TPA: hypothetical protein VIY49_04320 [Bryobacteraceae bacterium]